MKSTTAEEYFHAYSSDFPNREIPRPGCLANWKILFILETNNWLSRVESKECQDIDALSPGGRGAFQELSLPQCTSSEGTFT